MQELKTLFLTGYGLSLSVRNTRLVVKQGMNDPFGREKPQSLEMPVSAADFDKVVIQESGYVSTDAIQLLTDHNINIILLDSFGKLVANMSNVMASLTGTNYRIGQLNQQRNNEDGIRLDMCNVLA
jgi:CRISPR-associated protein Cas1